MNAGAKAVKGNQVQKNVFSDKSSLKESAREYHSSRAIINSTKELQKSSILP